MTPGLVALLLLCIGSVSAPPDTMALSPDAESYTYNGDTTTGRMFAYGQELVRPFVFSGIGTDQVSVNDAPLLPRRPRLDVAPRPTASPDSAQLALNSRMRELLAAARQAASAAEQPASRAARAADTFRSAPDVARVFFRDEPITFYVVFQGSDLEVPVIWNGSADSPASSVRSEQVLQINVICSALGAGQTVAFGDGYFLLLSPATSSRVLSGVRADGEPDMSMLGRFQRDVRRVGAEERDR